MKSSYHTETRNHKNKKIGSVRFICGMVFWFGFKMHRVTQQALFRRFCRAGVKKTVQSRPQKPVFRRLGPKLVPADPGRTRRPGGRLGSRHKRKMRVGPPWKRPEGLFPPFLDAFPSHHSRSLAFLPPFSPFLPPNPLPLAAKKYAMPRAAATATGAVAQPKQRKPRAPPSKPPGLSNAEWRVEVQRREAVTTDRRP